MRFEHTLRALIQLALRTTLGYEIWTHTLSSHPASSLEQHRAMRFEYTVWARNIKVMFINCSLRWYLTLSLPKHFVPLVKIAPKIGLSEKFADQPRSFRKLCSLSQCVTNGNWGQRSHAVLQTCRNHFAKDIVWRHNSSEWVKVIVNAFLLFDVAPARHPQTQHATRQNGAQSIATYVVKPISTKRLVTAPNNPHMTSLLTEHAWFMATYL